MSEANGLSAAIAQISDFGRAALKSKAMEGDERKSLQYRLTMFEVSVRELDRLLQDDDAKRHLHHVIGGAFLIGSSGTVSKSTTNYVKREKAAGMRTAKANNPRRLAHESAITAALGGRIPVEHLWTEAGKLLSTVNRRLKDAGFESDNDANAIYRSLTSRAGNPRTSRARKK